MYELTAWNGKTGAMSGEWCVASGEWWRLAWNEKLLMMYDFSYSDSVRWFSQSVRTRATYL